MPGKRLLVLGATGGTGREVVTQALQQGDEVTALERVRVIVGDVLRDREALESAVRSQDAVISALGVGKSLRSGGLIGRSTPDIVQAMERLGIRRLIVTSAYGVGDTWRDVPAVPRFFIRTLLRDLYADKEVGERPLRDSTLDWTLVYPVTLTNGPRTGHYRAGERLALRGFPTISRADVADFLLTQVEDRRYIRKGVLVSY